MIHLIKYSLLGLVFVSSLTACQLVIPKAKGLTSASWKAQDYQRQDQVEVKWKTQTFSFLLYQQQQGKDLDLMALSLTGQLLFKLKFDGQRVQVEQRIEPMKRLPFDYLVRDILFATYPNIDQTQQAYVEIQWLQDDVAAHQIQEIRIAQQKVLSIRYLQDYTELHNIQVPYQMIFSKILNTLENNE